jgi:hypothetical protein
MGNALVRGCAEFQGARGEAVKLMSAHRWNQRAPLVHRCSADSEGASHGGSITVVVPQNFNCSHSQ